MRILVLQHIRIEHPGIFRDFLAADGIEWLAVEVDQGEAIPTLSGFDALWVMGGPMDVWQEGEFPWLVGEKEAIREAVLERRMPFLGICLGHQLLADALGGRVEPMAMPEVGVLDVVVTPEGEGDPLFTGVSRVTKCLQWHGAEVTAPPEGGRVLARSPASAVQALGFGEYAYGIQYHVELTDLTVPEWGRVPEYRQSLERTLGRNGLPRLESAAKRHMADFNRNAKRLYDNFIALVREASRSEA